MRELLADLAGARPGSQSISEICRIRDVIAAASEAVFLTAERLSVRIWNDV
jgi:hypothetical protein